MTIFFRFSLAQSWLVYDDFLLLLKSSLFFESLLSLWDAFFDSNNLLIFQISNTVKPV